MIITLSQNMANSEFNLNVDGEFYAIKISYNCIFNKFYAVVLDSNGVQISADTMLDEEVDVLKTTNILHKLVFKGQQMPTYNNLSGYLELENL